MNIKMSNLRNHIIIKNTSILEWQRRAFCDNMQNANFMEMPLAIFFKKKERNSFPLLVQSKTHFTLSD